MKTLDELYNELEKAQDLVVEWEEPLPDEYVMALLSFSKNANIRRIKSEIDALIELENSNE
jgi:hypothetical protein